MHHENKYITEHKQIIIACHSSPYKPEITMILLNQVRIGRRLARAWFLEIVSVRTSVRVFVSAPRLLITSGVMRHDIDPIRLVKQVLQLLYGNCSRYH